MRNAVVVLAAVWFGCGGKAPTADHPAAPPTALGTTGYPGLDWGATAATVRAIYPNASATNDGHLALRGTDEGQPNLTTFEFVAGRLGKISIVFDRRFASMKQCGAVWTTLRAAFDPKLGNSAGENLAAFWESATYAVTLSCDLDDAERAGLSMSYAPAPPT